MSAFEYILFKRGPSSSEPVAVEFRPRKPGFPANQAGATDEAAGFGYLVPVRQSPATRLRARTRDGRRRGSGSGGITCVGASARLAGRGSGLLAAVGCRREAS